MIKTKFLKNKNKVEYYDFVITAVKITREEYLEKVEHAFRRDVDDYVLQKANKWVNRNLKTEHKVYVDKDYFFNESPSDIMFNSITLYFKVYYN